MKNFKSLALASILITTSCSIFSEQKREQPRIVYKNIPSTEVSLDSENAITKREKISIPSVSAQLKGEPVKTTEVISLTTATNTETIDNPNVTVKRIRVEEVTTENEQTPVTVTPGNTTVGIATAENNYGEDSQPNDTAEVGQCYGKVRVAGTFKQVMDKVVVEPERVRKQTIPAKYRTEEQDVVVREETTKYIEIPATYKIVTEQVVVEPEKKKITTIPAKYKTVQERVMVKPASKVWKKGRGLIEKPGSDGEIMCLVEEPAKYEVVSKQVLVEPERQEINIIPAITKIITKEVIDRPARVEKRTVPAIRKKIAKNVLVEEERTVDIKVPAKYKMVQKKVPLTQSKVTWRPVLCDYNITPNVIMKLQEALTLRGFDTGGVDGVFGSRTSAAINEFQKSLGLESSGITIETLRSLGVSY